MNWDEIEAKWAAMARRVRSDLPLPDISAGREQDPPTQPPGDLPDPPLPQSIPDIAR